MTLMTENLESNVSDIAQKIMGTTAADVANESRAKLKG